MTEKPAREPRTVESGLALLDVAQKAAAGKDATTMIEALHASGYLDGLVRRLQRQWPHLPRADVDDCVAEAVNSAYETVSSGRRVGQLGAWLWKAAHNLAGDRWRIEHEFRRPEEDLPEDAAEPVLDDEERERRDALAEHRRAEAVRLARQLLPRIGHGQVVAVMELVIETVEAGLPDLPSELIADTLGITPPAARALVSRGLERLRRVAKEEGIELTEELHGESCAKSALQTI